MGALTQVYVNPAIAGNSGTGTIGDPYGDLQYALNTKARDSTNGDQFNIKAGTAEVLAAALTLGTYGNPTEAAPLVLRGYTAAANDGGMAEINCNSYTLWANQSYPHLTMAWLYIHDGGSNDLLDVNNAPTTVIHCKVTRGAGSPNFKSLVYLNANSVIIDSYVYDAGSNGFGIRGCKLVYGCYVYNCVRGMYDVGAAERNIIVDCPTAGINMITDFQIAKSNTIYSSIANTGKGIAVDSGVFSTILINNYIEGYNGVGGVPISVANDAGIIGNNAYYNCNAEALGDVRVSLPSYILGESALRAPANGDYSIRPWVGSVVENSYPTSWYGPAATLNKADIGAVQNGASSNWITKFQRSRRSAYVNR